MCEDDINQTNLKYKEHGRVSRISSGRDEKY
jgi:hypothetical protein